MCVCVCVGKSHQFLHSRHGAVGMAQRVRQPIHSVTCLAVSVETNCYASAEEGDKERESMRGRRGVEKEAERERGRERKDRQKGLYLREVWEHKALEMVGAVRR